MFALRERLVLGSASPRRRELLARFGLDCAVFAPEVDETPRLDERPEAYLERVVAAKLDAVSAQFVEDPVALLVADTTVVAEGTILGKPTDPREARETLERLVGRTHRVLTRYALRNVAGEVLARTSIAEVTFRGATDEEIRAYVATGEGADKAGAYALQGLGGYFVERISGDPTTIVGLPVSDVLRDLLDLGILELRG